MRSTGMEMLRLWGRWSYTREVTLDRLSFLKSSFNSAAQEGALVAAPQKWAFSATISIKFLRGSQALLEACESHQCSHSLLTAWRDGLPYKRSFPRTLVLRHGHTAESCCPPVSGDSAPTTRNAATFLVHPDPTAIFTCPTQNQERGFQKKNVYSGQMHFASFLLLSGV